MASVKSNFIAASIGSTVTGDQVEAVLADTRYTLAQAAGILSTTPTFLTYLLGQAGPPTAHPINWTKQDTGPYPYPGPFSGVAPIVYTGPSEPGFTYGNPVYVSDLPPCVSSQND